MSLSETDEEGSGDLCKATGSEGLGGVEIRLGIDSLLLAVVSFSDRTFTALGIDAVLSECLMFVTPLVASLRLCGTLALVSSRLKLDGREESLESVEGDPLPFIIWGILSGNAG